MGLAGYPSRGLTDRNCTILRCWFTEKALGYRSRVEVIRALAVKLNMTELAVGAVISTTSPVGMYDR